MLENKDLMLQKWKNVKNKKLKQFKTFNIQIKDFRNGRNEVKWLYSILKMKKYNFLFGKSASDFLIKEEQEKVIEVEEAVSNDDEIIQDYQPEIMLDDEEEFFAEIEDDAGLELNSLPEKDDAVKLPADFFQNISTLENNENGNLTLREIDDFLKSRLTGSSSENGLELCQIIDLALSVEFWPNHFKFALILAVWNLNPLKDNEGTTYEFLTQTDRMRIRKFCESVKRDVLESKMVYSQRIITQVFV